MNDIDLSVTSLDVLASVISFAGTFKRFVWTQTPDAVRDPWTIISALVGLLPNLGDLLLSSDLLDAHRIMYPPLLRIQLPHDVGCTDFLAFKYSKFQELAEHDKNLEALLEAFCTLEMFAFTFDMGIGRLITHDVCSTAAIPDSYLLSDRLRKSPPQKPHV